ncbi:Cytochrome c oxidase subunit I [Hyphomicrobiales bacterium]|nr:Cytochrome c oxidase subunit I [Hyphomicrobiales bacterium]CAH1699139.1 Cytochrome c oxidase subunit I [Hyphomicrobiales bacterium]CAI0342929.1 Cytochrome c oxidase subunit I [Hyphomicrobiales bacterium]
MGTLENGHEIPLPLAAQRQRNLPAGAALSWLGAGWRDLCHNPLPSLLYGLAVFLVSLAIVWGLFRLELDYILFPALAGFMVVGPVLAIGLYQKSRDIEQGQPISLGRMIFVKPASGAQVWFTGALLCLLMLVWMRAAVIIYALFFGLRPFPGLRDVATMLVSTPEGWAMLLVGTVAGGLFAAFSFAISTFAIPMLLDERVDAFTAMGTSISLVWNNIPVMIAWGAIVLGLFLFGVATGLLGLIVVFPLLGHATWHSYRAIR